MAGDVVCFLIEETDRYSRHLRRYATTRDDERCPLHGYHNALVNVEKGTCPAGEFLPHEDPDRADPRWPTHCPCGYAFTPDDHWQVFPDRIYRRPDTGETFPLKKAPPGAMWYAAWLERRAGEQAGGAKSNMGVSPTDGRALVVRLPTGHDWYVDGVCTNCTRPGDFVHKCWVRTGKPPVVTVGKGDDPAGTCSAGGGSILVPGWHGFLIAGVLSTSRTPGTAKRKR